MLARIQPSLRDKRVIHPPPNAEALGYSHASLPDENKALAAFNVVAFACHWLPRFIPHPRTRSLPGLAFNSRRCNHMLRFPGREVAVRVYMDL